jgi:hypothetical protein
MDLPDMIGFDYYSVRLMVVQSQIHGNHNPKVFFNLRIYSRQTQNILSRQYFLTFFGRILIQKFDFVAFNAVT